MSWSGKMRCDVVNEMGGNIAVVARHVWGSHTNTFPLTLLANLGSKSFEIEVGSGDSDLWSVWIMDANGTFWYREDKMCNVEQGDLKTKDAVVLNLGPGTKGFSIKLPKTSSCNDNYYDRGR